jgi:hypothetical protein
MNEDKINLATRNFGVAVKLLIKFTKLKEQ